jgi:hypothetical protein
MPDPSPGLLKVIVAQIGLGAERIRFIAPRAPLQSSDKPMVVFEEMGQWLTRKSTKL